MTPPDPSPLFLPLPCAPFFSPRSSDIVSFWYGVLEPSRVMQPVAGTNGGGANGAWLSYDLYNVLLRLYLRAGDTERIVQSLLDQAVSVAPECVLLGMANSKVDEQCDSDTSGNDPNQLRLRLYNTLLVRRGPPVCAPRLRVCVHFHDPPCPIPATPRRRPLRRSSHSRICARSRRGIRPRSCSGCGRCRVR